MFFFFEKQESQTVCLNFRTQSSKVHHKCKHRHGCSSHKVTFFIVAWAQRRQWAI